MVGRVVRGSIIIERTTPHEMRQKVGLAAQLHGASRLVFKPYVHYVTTCNSKKCR
jgi:hypothetical protein